MDYSAQEVMQYAKEADVKMIRLAFCDVFGRQKNIVIMPRELERAFGYGIAIDGSAISGFGGAVRSDLILHPEPSTLTLLPWRPETGKVVRMFCDISYPDGTAFECDTRGLLKKAAAEAEKKGLVFSGINEKANLVEIIENENHPFFIACQFHPEFKSRPTRPHPLFEGFIKSCIKKSSALCQIVLVEPKTSDK